MYANILVPRQWSRLTCLCRYSSAVEGQKLPQASQSADGISPPLRIHRSPTDILEALAATVGPDPTAAHYKYHDDPFLIPLSNFRKRAYALSAEAGRKAAAWIRDEHAELFNTRVWDPPGKKKTPYYNAAPFIDAFAPRPIYNDESKVTEDDLQYTISNALVDDSVKIFQLLGGAENVNDDLKLQFLQLLCFYNEKEPESMEWLEERWVAANTRDRHSTTWRVGGLAEKIFTSMEPKTAEAYCALIQGMAKHYQAERAYTLTQEATEKGLTLSADVYNSLIACIGFLKEGSALRIETLNNTLAQMDEQGIAPNLGTLTACLQSLSVWGSGKPLQQLAINLLAEFKKLGIQPGLAAYYHLLCLFCKERGPRVDILSGILQDLESRSTLEATLPADTNFFVTAMGVCSDHLQNIQMADRVHALLMKGDNYKFVGDAYKESIYYRHYVTVSCRHAPFEKTTTMLDTLVPNVYVPEPSVMEEIIRTLELAGCGERLAQSWSQLVVFGHAKRVKLVETILAAMCNCYQYQDEEVKAKMRAAAADILKYGKIAEEDMEGKDMRTPNQNNIQRLSAKALTDIVSLCSSVSEKSSEESWESVSEALQRLNGQEAAGNTNPVTLVKAAKQAAIAGKYGIAAMAITYLAECGFEEASTASVQVLSTMLNRDEAEVSKLLQEPKSALEVNLHPSAAVIYDAYHVSQSDASRSNVRRTDTSSSSDSESDSD